jgi:hypothetical protein
MNNKAFKKLAKEAGFVFLDNKSKDANIDWSSDYTEELKKFAKLIVTKERDKARRDRIFDEAWSK